MEIAKEWKDLAELLAALASILLVYTTIVLTCISRQTFNRDTPKLHLELCVSRLSNDLTDSPLNLRVTVANIGYRNSILRRIAIDGCKCPHKNTRQAKITYHQQNAFSLLFILIGKNNRS